MATATSNHGSGKRKTAEEWTAEVEALADQLNEAVVELTSSQAWLRMLRVSARFTRYSANNVLLLWMQAEQRGVDLSRVAGYRAWQAMGRQVVKGARSFSVLAPVRRRLSADEAAQRAAAGQPAYDGDGRPAVVVRGFRLERVFRSSPAHRCSSPYSVHMCSSRGAGVRSRGGVAPFGDVGSPQQLIDRRFGLRRLERIALSMPRPRTRMRHGRSLRRAASACVAHRVAPQRRRHQIGSPQNGPALSVALQPVGSRGVRVQRR
jgi:hypothetical protein